ncbi:MAG: antibiotic biosynthesis monooxygenase [Leptolyngbyaceae bacterium]|nr:antibiotic biosynthesis monooxygenase [Leptolyngbyaceae bacterium]
MGDFQDFLTRECVHVAVGEFKPGKFDEARQLYEQAVSTYAGGFKGAYLLRDPESDRGISVIFWNSVEDMEANQGEAHNRILKQMAPLFSQQPDVHLYEVACQMGSEQNSVAQHN